MHGVHVQVEGLRAELEDKEAVIGDLHGHLDARVEEMMGLQGQLRAKDQQVGPPACRAMRSCDAFCCHHVPVVLAGRPCGGCTPAPGADLLFCWPQVAHHLTLLDSLQGTLQGVEEKVRTVACRPVVFMAWLHLAHQPATQYAH